MTKKDFNYTGTTEGRLGYEDKKWSYTGVGLNFYTNTFFVNKGVDEEPDQIKTLELIGLAFRQYKQVKTGSNTVHRASPYASNNSLPDGKVQNRMQLALVMPDDPTKIYVLGHKSYTARMSFLCDFGLRGWNNDKFQTGIWTALKLKQAEIKEEHGVDTPFNAWRFSITYGQKKVTVGSGEESQEVRPIVLASDFEYVGNDLALQLDALYKKEDLDGWITQYDKVGVTVENATPSQTPSDTPDQPEYHDDPNMQPPSKDEDEEIPF